MHVTSYEAALESAVVAAIADGMPPVVFRVRVRHEDGSEAVLGHTDFLSGAVDFAALIACDDSTGQAFIDRQRGEEGPWVAIRKITVTCETLDQEVG